MAHHARTASVAGSLLVLLAFVPAPASAIVGGQAASPGEYPWQAAITSGSGSSQYCGGTLVDPVTVVTAAHCMGGLLGIPLVDDLIDLVLPPNVYVLLGTNSLSSGGESIEASEIFVHPQYDGDHDVAVLKLSRPSTLGVPLAYAHPGDESYYPPGTLATTTGWGATSEGGSGSDELREVQVPIVSDAQCAAYYGSSLDPATEVCAGYAQGGKDSCQGDSGGPFIVPKGSGWLLVGVVSWGDGCARPNVPGVYAEVAALSAFIDQHLGSGGSAAASSAAPALPAGGLPADGPQANVLQVPHAPLGRLL